MVKKCPEELAADLSADVFIRCLRRFTARRGLPEITVSDNAKTFKAAAKVLRKVFSYPSVKRFLANRRITWRFNIDRAPWWGGFFERMIQNAKRCLRKTLANAKLDYDELHTLLVEVEGTLNSRPLTYLSSDDVEEPLTPFHLIYGRGIISLPEVTPGREASLNQAASSNDGPTVVARSLLEALEERVRYRVAEPASSETQTRRQYFSLSWRC